MTFRPRQTRDRRPPDLPSLIARLATCLAGLALAFAASAQATSDEVTSEQVTSDPVTSYREEPSAPEGSIELGLGHTDNLNRDADELESDIGRLAIAFAGRTDRRFLKAGLAGDLEYQRYDADGLEDDDEVLGSVGALLGLLFVPDRLEWDFRYDYGQVRIDPVGAVGPSNRQWTTSLQTGPRLRLPVGNRTHLQVGGLLSEQNFEQTRELDSRLTAARIALTRQVDPVTSVTLALEDSETEYELDAETYDISTLSLEYRRELASGEAFATIGSGNLEIGGDDQRTTVAQLVWNRAIGTRSRLELCAGREITGAGALFTGAGVAAGCPGDFSTLANVGRTNNNRVEGIVPVTSPLVRSGASVTLEVDGRLGTLRMTYSETQDRFEDTSTYDNDSTVVEIEASRGIGTRWHATLSARRWDQDYKNLGDDNEDRSLYASLSRLLAHRARITFSFEHVTRVSGFEPFDENRYFISFGRDFGRSGER